MKHRLLIIDNDECAIDGIKLFLESSGFAVDFASDGDHGVALVRQSAGRYSMALVDFFLDAGKTTGLEVIREIRKINSASLIFAKFHASGSHRFQMLGSMRFHASGAT
jgi:DNA-binding response OmpR family regulator